jgi:hypothetical protein
MTLDYGPIILAGGTVVAGYLARSQHKIHVLVNARLSEALQEIKDLKKQLESPPTEPGE